MFRAVMTQLKYDFYSFYNGLIFYLQKIPLLGKAIPNKAYNINGVDGIIPFVSLVFSFISSLVKKFIYYFFLIGTVFVSQSRSLLELLLSDAEMVNLTSKSIFEFYIIFFTFVAVLNSMIYFYDVNFPQKYIHMKLMKIEPRSYLLGGFIYEAILFIVSFTLVNTFVFNLFEIETSLKEIFYFIVFAYSFRLLMATIFIKFKILDKGIYKKINYIYWTLLILSVVAAFAYLIIVKDLPKFQFLYDIKALIIGLLISIISIYYLLKNNDINQVAYNYLNYSELTNADLEQVNVNSYKVKEDDIEKGKADFSNLKGIEFVNKLFFQRTMHQKKGLVQRIRKNLVRIVFFAIAVGIVYHFRDIIVNFDPTFRESSYKFGILFYVVPYFAFNGDRFTRFCFMNMDLAFMKYSFYRRKDILIKSIFVRAKEMLLYYLPAFVGYIIAGGSLGYILNLPKNTIFNILLFSILGYLVFTLHYLYMYYIIQPFTENLETKSPLYTGVTWAIYMITYILIGSDIDEKIIGYVYLSFSIIYIVVGFLAVMHFAPKRFKLR